MYMFFVLYFVVPVNKTFPFKLKYKYIKVIVDLISFNSIERYV